MLVNLFDLTLLLQGDGEQVNRDNLPVGKVQVNTRRVALGLYPAPLLPMVTNRKECNQQQEPTLTNPPTCLTKSDHLTGSLSNPWGLALPTGFLTGEKLRVRIISHR